MVKKVRLVEERDFFPPPFYFGERIRRSSLLLIALESSLRAALVFTIVVVAE